MKAIVFIDVQNDFLKNEKLAYAYSVEDNGRHRLASLQWDEWNLEHYETQR